MLGPGESEAPCVPLERNYLRNCKEQHSAVVELHSWFCFVMGWNPLRDSEEPNGVALSHLFPGELNTVEPRIKDWGIVLLNLSPLCSSVTKCFGAPHYMLDKCWHKQAVVTRITVWWNGHLAYLHLNIFNISFSKPAFTKLRGGTSFLSLSISLYFFWP